jgi:glyoxylase-like metal-dependent hydrolase (beta-lactamase superfamily II)
MPVKLLNCASMSPWWPHWQIGGVSLLVDRHQGPVLVDTGLGLHDHEAPSRLVRFFRLDFGIPYQPDETAIRQLPRLGVQPADIHHIVLTHLHFDHAGGLADFPWAQVHLHRKEYEALQRPKKLIERFAYDQADFAHGPNWVTYENTTENWFGFEAIPLPFEPRMYLVPLFGHTSGHCGVAIEDEDGWIFQAGDAIPLNAQFEVTPGWLNRIVLGPHCARLKRFSAEHPEVRLLAGHAWRTFFSGKESG